MKRKERENQDCSGCSGMVYQSPCYGFEIIKQVERAEQSEERK
jgi:hypothetical protein